MRRHGGRWEGTVAGGGRGGGRQGRHGIESRRLAGHGASIFMMQVVDRKMELSVPQAQGDLFASADAGLWLDLPIARHGRGNRSHP